MKKDILIYFGGKIIPAAVNLAIIILAVRFLGKAEYGKYSLVFYATMLLSTLSFGWIQQSILRFLSAYPNEQVLVINRLFFLNIVSTVSAVIMGFFLCIFYFHLLWLDTLVVILYIFIYNIFLFHLILNQTRRKSSNYAILEGSYYLVYFALFLLMSWVFHMYLFNVLFIAMLGGLLVTEFIRITLVPDGRVGLDVTRIYFQPDFSKKVFSFGFPITIWLFSSYLLNISDRFIIKEFCNYEDVGTYAAVKDFIIKIVTFTTIPILLAYHPLIVEKWNKGHKKDALKEIRVSLRYFLLIAVVILALFIPFRTLIFTKILHLQVKNEFLVSIVLICSAFLWQSALMLQKPLELLFKTRLMLLAIVVALAVNGVANVLLIPRFGYTAAAIVSLGSVSIYIIVIFALLFRFRKQGLFTESGKTK
jgi:O-antigen/teichoic acid export membrane protein